MIIKLRYGLRALVVLILGPSYLFGDNKSVVTNTTLPSSTLKKKHNAIAYHKVREAIAAKIFGFCHMPGVVNVADILTKPLGPQVHQRHARPLLHQNPYQVTDQGDYQDASSATVTGDQWFGVTSSISRGLTET